MNTPNKIALMRPKLPDHDAVLPYWREIDSTRWYTNFGPLSLRLEKRMAEFFGYNDDCVVTVSNGTAGLTNILRALDLPRGTHCLLPSWTFMATPAAVVSAGFIPYFIDVDEKTWALDPETVRVHLKKLGSKVSSVMVVAPFGAPLDMEAWDRLTKETGIPVIIDAAAGFDAFSLIESSRPRRNPVMISLHATKTLGTGEGGIVISSHAPLIQRIREMSNFGFSDTRIITIPGTNGKMSEYHAAVGHAALDGWKEKRATFERVKTCYSEAIKKAALPVYAPSLEGDWVASTLNVRLSSGSASTVIEQLNNSGIESRKWWGSGCYAHPAYMIYPRAELPVTEKLGDSIFALPFTVDMTQDEVQYVVDMLAHILQKHAQERAYA